jgi:flagellar basal body-associated protein FliL
MRRQSVPQKRGDQQLASFICGTRGEEDTSLIRMVFLLQHLSPLVVVVFFVFSPTAQDSPSPTAFPEPPNVMQPSRTSFWRNKTCRFSPLSQGNKDKVCDRRGEIDSWRASIRGAATKKTHQVVLVLVLVQHLSSLVVLILFVFASTAHYSLSSTSFPEVTDVIRLALWFLREEHIQCFSSCFGS